jgi:hypothetical protein
MTLRRPAFPPHLLALLAALITTTMVYTGGLSGGFMFDDHPNITRNALLHIDALSWNNLVQAATSLRAGPLGRPIAMASLGLNYYFGALDPFGYKLANLLIHLLCGIAVFLLARALVSAHLRRNAVASGAHAADWIAVAAAAVWLLHPFNLSAVLYVVQRMASLAALFMLAGLAFYASGRLRQLEGRRGGWLLIATGLLVCGPLAVFSKENGLLLPFLMFVTEWTVFGFDSRTRAQRRGLFVFHGLVAVLPGLAVAAYLATHVDWLRGMYVSRDFTLEERLLTQPRVVWLYLALTLVPATSWMGLYHDDIAVSRSLIDPAITLPALVGLVALACTALVLRRRAPLVSFGVLFFLVAHSMESSVFSLEMAHEHRNYLPAFGIVLPVIYHLLAPRPHARALGARRGAVLALLAGLAVATAVRAHNWGDDFRRAYVDARNHPQSSRSQYALGTQYYERMLNASARRDRYYRLARQSFERAAQANANYLGPLFALIQLDAYNQKEPRADWLAALAKGLREQPFAPSTAVGFRDLTHCIAVGECGPAADNMDVLFDAAFSNPTLAGLSLATVHTQAMIIALQQGDMQRAISHGRASLEADPDSIQRELNLINVLTQSGHAAEARDRIERLKQKQLPDLSEGRLASLEAALAGKEPAGTDPHPEESVEGRQSERPVH